MHKRWNTCLLNSLMFISLGVWNIFNANCCEMLIPGLQTCYTIIDIKVPQYDSPSPLHLPLDYLKSCGLELKQRQFLKCYENLLQRCPDYRKVNPVMLDFISLKAMMYGICANKEEYAEGIKCFEKMSDHALKYINHCVDVYDSYMKAFEAVTSGNWTSYCSHVPKRIKCLSLVLDTFQCKENFRAIVINYMHVIQPPMCRNESLGYHWITTYGLSRAHGAGKTLHLWIVIMVIIAWRRNILHT